MHARSHDCEAAREWASAALDGELSGFEQARLRSHLRLCAECEAFSHDVASLTNAIRDAALVAPDRLVALPRHRRRVPRLRFTAAAAAAAAAVVALGLASSISNSSGGRSPFDEPTIDQRVWQNLKIADQAQRGAQRIEVQLRGRPSPLEREPLRPLAP